MQFCAWLPCHQYVKGIFFKLFFLLLLLFFIAARLSYTNIAGHEGLYLLLKTKRGVSISAMLPSWSRCCMDQAEADWCSSQTRPTQHR